MWFRKSERGCLTEVGNITEAEHHQERTASPGGTEEKEKSKMILPADKGKATVIMDTHEYEQTVTTMLSEHKNYEKLNKVPIPKQ